MAEGANFQEAIDVEKKVLQAVRKSSKPQEPAKIIQVITADPSAVREAIRSLVNSGDLQLTLDWKVRAK